MDAKKDDFHTSLDNLKNFLEDADEMYLKQLNEFYKNLKDFQHDMCDKE